MPSGGPPVARMPCSVRASPTGRTGASFVARASRVCIAQLPCTQHFGRAATPARRNAAGGPGTTTRIRRGTPQIRLCSSGAIPSALSLASTHHCSEAGGAESLPIPMGTGLAGSHSSTRGRISSGTSPSTSPTRRKRLPWPARAAPAAARVPARNQFLARRLQGVFPASRGRAHRKCRSGQSGWYSAVPRGTRESPSTSGRPRSGNGGAFCMVERGPGPVHEGGKGHRPLPPPVPTGSLRSIPPRGR